MSDKVSDAILEREQAKAPKKGTKAELQAKAKSVGIPAEGTVEELKEAIADKETDGA